MSAAARQGFLPPAARAARAAVAAVALALCAVGSAAADDFSVQDVWFAKNEDGYAVRARLNLEQAERLDALLRGGYVAPMRFELHFRQQKKWQKWLWGSNLIADIVWRGLLSYDALTKVYYLRVGGRDQRFASLRGAVARIKNLRGAASGDTDYQKIFQMQGVFVEARFYMETDGFPEPIKIALLLDDEWDTGGAWREFPLRVEEK